LVVDPSNLFRVLGKVCESVGNHKNNHDKESHSY
jgi:hypothetical protein